MENYYENTKKYNKMLWKYLCLIEENSEDVHSEFNPQENLEVLGWVFQKIRKNPREGYIIRIIISQKQEEVEIFIQEWYDVANPKGFVNVTQVKEKNEYRAMYNASIDYIIKTT